ncbi:MAG TPA: alginate lyase family protein [Steroidobacteraceae bacterium]|nr:alginate lyase family protein [Steroidobacteraceae bacterium]
MSALTLYFHTVRHLRPIQIAARAWFRLHRPLPDLRAAPATRPRSGRYSPPIAAAPSLLGPHMIRLLNVERSCAVASDWRPQDATKLWTYHLHYFDDLNARDADARVLWHENLLTRWAVENPPGQGEGWEPYPVSRRIVNCVKWAARGNTLPASFRKSLAVQTRWLKQRLEYHILGNHLFANAKALVHAGLYFDGPEAEHWWVRGMHLLDRELHEQILPDGGHVELSTMYQAGILEDLLDLVNLLRAYGRVAPRSWIAAIERMREWLKVMSHPDGEIAFFNDAAFGATPVSAELEAYAGRLDLPAAPCQSPPVAILESSGYVRVSAPPAYLICDCASVAADHLPGHAHADALSFELSLGAHRVLVNSGTSQYGTGAERQRQRGTAAHNTVVVDGEDSSEVWAGFRVARRARVKRRPIKTTPNGVTIDASHDGYRRLPGRNEHRRCFTVDQRALRIEDVISGPFTNAAAYFHVHPEVDARIGGAAEVLLSRGDGLALRLVFEGASALEVRSGTWHPRFGVVVPNRCIVASFAGAKLTTTMIWAPSP